MSRPAPSPWWTELPLVGLHVAIVFGFARLYDDGSFLVPLLAFVLAAHLLAIATRRAGVPVPIVVVLALAGAVLSVTWILFPATTHLGLPTGRTWQAAADALDVARAKYPVVVAPAPVLAGFQLSLGLALWTTVWFADWTAHRLRATAEAAATGTALFVFTSIIGSGQYRLASSAGFLAALLLYLGVARREALHRAQGRPLVLDRARGAGLGSVLLVGSVAVVAALLLGPILPGADADPALHWRNSSGGDSSRVTVSPLVEMHKRLVDQSNRLVFQVRSTEKAYWRLTSLDRFDGDIWSSSGEFRPASQHLPSTMPSGSRADRSSDLITQRFTIKALSAIWAPSAFEAASVSDTDAPLRWDPRSSTLIVDSSEPTTDGLSYTVTSRAPTFDPLVLARAGTDDPPAIASVYESLPSGFPALARGIARQVTQGASSRYDKARALQDWFRSNFEYSTDVPASHSDDALVGFLRSRTGYCEQFSGAFAAMARSLGIPARVAVGFTPGNPTARNPDVYQVLGRHAHAWPEVYFPRIGWVPFEPTPGRGIPGATNYTGVPAQQDDARPINIATTTAPPETTTTVAGADGPSPVTRATTPDRTETVAADPNPHRSSGRTAWAIVAAVVAATGAAAVAVARRRRQGARVAALGPTEHAWSRVEAVLAARHGIVASATDTPFDLAHAAVPVIGDRAEALIELADLVTEARWSADGLDARAAARADELADQLVAEPVDALPVS